MTKGKVQTKQKGSQSQFNCDVNYCSRCGAVLPALGPTGGLSCVVCKHEVDINILEDYHVKYVVEFNARDNYNEERKLKQANKGQAEGPIAERRCSNCGNETMSYASLQLRSADEGQTIFFTCTRCKHKETENS